MATTPLLTYPISAVFFKMPLSFVQIANSSKCSLSICFGVDNTVLLRQNLSVLSVYLLIEGAQDK